MKVYEVTVPLMINDDIKKTSFCNTKSECNLYKRTSFRILKFKLISTSKIVA